MEIKLIFNTYSYSICFGRKAASFSSSYAFSITKEYYDNMHVIHANFILGLFKTK